MSRTDAHRPWHVRVNDQLDPCYRDDPFVARLSSDHPPRWYLLALWWTPERQRTRRALRAAARTYNAQHSLDDFDLPVTGTNRRLRSDW